MPQFFDDCGICIFTISIDSMTAGTKLQVLIATHQTAGIERVCDMDLPRVEGVEYLVSWQTHGNLPVPSALSARADISVLRFDGVGVSANRNNLLNHATAPLVLIADDDLCYAPGAFGRIIEVAEANPDVDYFSFRYDGADNKNYPPEVCSLKHLPKGFYQTAFEVALRRSPRTEGLQFNEKFGPGAPVFTAGEDEMLLLTARRMGLVCRFFPLTITCHKELTTGSRPLTPGTARSAGAIIRLQNPLTWFLRIPVYAWRRSKEGRMTFRSALCHAAYGAFHVAGTMS